MRDGYRSAATLRDRGRLDTRSWCSPPRTGCSDQTEALDTGADDYLTKPFSFPVLVAHVRALLRRTSGGVPVPVEVGDLRLDSARHRCWRGDVELSLTAREFAVLEYLMRRVDLVNPKHEILGGVWEYDFEGDPNIVEVYVRRLRRKIDEPFGPARSGDGARGRLSAVQSRGRCEPGVKKFGTVRAELTFLATVLVAAMLSASAVGLVVAQFRVLQHAIDESLIQRADNIQVAVRRRDAGRPATDRRRSRGHLPAAARTER